MSLSVGSNGSGTPDVVNLYALKKAMSAEQTKTAALLKGMEQAAPPPPPTAQRTWYL